MIRILLTNDDGIEAPGLIALQRRLLECTDVELWTVAPDRQRSACGHGMSLESPVRVQTHGSRCYRHSGLVVDGVYFALYHLLENTPPDLVISGINRGANLAEDVLYSGTVAGAREAALRGIHAISVSLTSGENFEPVAKSVIEVARILLDDTGNTRPWLLNLNYPPPPFTGPFLVPSGTRPYLPRVTEVSTSMVDETHYRLGGPLCPDATPPPGTDVDLISRGIAAMTPLRIDQTDHSQLTAPHYLSFRCPEGLFR